METLACFRKTPTSWVAYLFLFLGLAAMSAHGQGTRDGFYSTSCPTAEDIVTTTVTNHLQSNPRIAPGLLRLHFHDCFLRGCDGSVLIDGPDTEKAAVQNSGIPGYNVIDDAKTQLETVCPGVVSCSDILALAARDSVVLSTGGVGWEVPTGRRDGVVSLQSDAATLPRFDEPVSSQLAKFLNLGLNTQDLVVLLGSHTIGTTSCALFRYRLFNFSNETATGADPTIDPDFLPTLRALCPQDGDATRRVDIDNGSGSNFDTSYFNNLMNGRGILESDQFLWTSPETQPIVTRLLNPNGPQGLDFGVEFARSMIKMSNVGVLTGNNGEIRRVCSAIN